MGIDVNLYADGQVSDEELTAAVAFFADRGLRGTPMRATWEPNRIEIDMDGARYYGPGYERGPWVQIHACILATVAAFPNCTVHYGGDCDFDAPEVAGADLTAIWAHWLSARWDDYHKPRPSREGNTK